jgi:serine/threonine-protein kinase
MSDSTQGLTSCAACGTAFPQGARFCPNCGVALEPSARDSRGRGPLAARGDPLVGQVIADRYRILTQLGRGGMGVVYQVEHVHIGKLMAMKLLSGELARDALTLKRFQREAQAVSQLGHPNTVQIFDFGESEGLAYLVMEYLPGRDLATIIFSEGALPFTRVAKIGAQIAGSVEEAHQRGVIHRDIKPENVMVLDTSEQSDFVKVLDFGIAKLRALEPGAPETAKGHLLGTPYYMAPEQIRGDPIDGRVDIYALGALMYKAVTGVTPFTADMPMEVLTKHLNEPLVPPRKRAPERDIPLEAERIISKALAKKPEQRYASMAELRTELTRYLAAQGIEGATVPPAHVSLDTFATRGDIDGYEGKLRRASRFSMLGALLLSLLAGAGVYAWLKQRGERPVAGVEQEPNDEPASANLLVSDKPVSAQIGKRRSTTESDADVYRIEAAGERRVADLRVTPLPNIDLVLDLVEKGSLQPLLTVDTGGVGEPERIPNITLSADTYFLRVRGKVKAGEYPIENVSDRYSVALALAPPAVDGEREPNDAFEVAEPLPSGETRRGLIGWAKDRDSFCLRTSSPRELSLSGVARLDLVLALLDRRTNVGQKVDRNGVGEGERVEIPGSKAEREVCVTVSARDREGAEAANFDQHYQLALR